MFSAIMVGYDGSDSSRDALALGEVLADPVAAELTVARVYPWGPSNVADEPSLADLDRAARSVGGRVEIVASDGPAAGLQDLAAELGAELVIVGSDGRDDTRRTSAGRVGLQLLNGSPCPVAVAPRGFARRYAPDIRSIAVGYDCSEEATAVLLHVVELARGLGAHIRVIAVCSGQKEARGKAADSLSDALESLPPDVATSGVVRSGDAAGVLLEEAARGGELLAVGSRGHGPLGRALLGSVSARLMREAPCPVLVAPRFA